MQTFCSEISRLVTVLAIVVAVAGFLVISNSGQGVVEVEAASLQLPPSNLSPVFVSYPGPNPPPVVYGTAPNTLWRGTSTPVDTVLSRGGFTLAPNRFDTMWDYVDGLEDGDRFPWRSTSIDPESAANFRDIRVSPDCWLYKVRPGDSKSLANVDATLNPGEYTEGEYLHPAGISLPEILKAVKFQPTYKPNGAVAQINPIETYDLHTPPLLRPQPLPLSNGGGVLLPNTTAATSVEAAPAVNTAASPSILSGVSTPALATGAYGLLGVHNLIQEYKAAQQNGVNVLQQLDYDAGNAMYNRPSVCGPQGC